MQTCAALLTNGRQCTRHVDDSTYCWQHSSIVQLRRDLAKAQGPNKVTTLISAIRANHGPGGLDLSGQDFGELDLSEQVLRPIAAEMHGPQVWLTSRLGRVGINLIGADLRGAFLPRANLSFARMQLSDLSNVDLYGADLRGADLYRANLAGATMYKAQLRDAKLERADLSGADLRLANLTGANLLRARLDGTLLGKDAIGPRLIQEDKAAYAAYVADDGKLHDFALARKLNPQTTRNHLYPIAGVTTEPSDYEIEISRLHVEQRYVEAREIYLALKACFDQQSLTDDASWAHYRARRMQRKSYFPTSARYCYPGRWSARPGWRSPTAWLSAGRFLGRWVVQYIFEITSGYGERPGRTLGALAAAFAIFTLLIAGLADLGQGPGAASLGDCLLFSLGSLTSIGFNDLTPVNAVGKLLASLEGAFGISFFALFMYTLGNRMGKG